VKGNARDSRPSRVQDEGFQEALVPGGRIAAGSIAESGIEALQIAFLSAAKRAAALSLVPRCVAISSWKAGRHRPRRALEESGK